MKTLVSNVTGGRVRLRTRSPIGIDVGVRAVKAVQLGRDRFGGAGWRVTAARWASHSGCRR